MKIDLREFKSFGDKIKTEISVEAVRIAKASMKKGRGVSEAGSPPNIKTGALKKSIGVNKSGIEAAVPYAAELESGSREVRARPFLRVAVEQAMKNLGYK